MIMASRSRLDKLYELLESNNSSIRTAASIQIGQIAGNCQLQLHSLLNKLLPYIQHKNWAVRISAADALRHIGRSTKLWIPNGRRTNINDNGSHLISLDNLNLLEILKIGTRLYSTDIKELEGYAVDPSLNKVEINKHLGLLLPGKDATGMSDNMIVDNEDFGVFVSMREEDKVSVQEAVESCQTRRGGLKRGRIMHDEEEGPGGKVACTEDECTWPWVDLCQELLLSLWHHKWEVRHGAATALRELIRSQGSVMVDKDGMVVSRVLFHQSHSLFLEDVVARILCTLALDQLSDFVNDEMVAPVRESCAQCLGLITVHLSDNALISVTHHLLTLLGHHEWTVTHGALLGLKYVLASRLNSLTTLLPMIYDPICSHLRDSRDDDVRCAAAAALMPIFANTATRPNIGQLDALRTDLWTVLALRVDYTSPGATGAVLNLLERLYDTTQVTPVLPDQTEISSSLNRLHWCYYNFGESVRLAALRTCRAMVRYYGSSLDEIASSTLFQVLTQLYQRVLIDDSVHVTKEAESVWQIIVGQVKPERVAVCCVDKLDMWLCWAMQPARLSYNVDSLLMPDTEEHTVDGELLGIDNKHQLPMEFFIGGRESHLVAGSSNTRHDAVLAARLAACRCMASLCHRVSLDLPSLDTHILATLFTHTHLKERLAMQRFVAASVLSSWPPVQPGWAEARGALLGALRAQLIASLEEPIYYQELLPQFKEMVKWCRQLVAVHPEHGLASSHLASASTLNLAQCQALVSEHHQHELTSHTSQSIASYARTTVDMCALQHGQLTRLVDVSLAKAILAWHWLPPRLTPLIRPLMDAMRTETRAVLQREAAIALSLLIVESASPQIVPAVSKLVRNIVASLSESIDDVAPMAELGPGIVVLHKVAQLGHADVFPGQESVCGEMDGECEAIVTKLRGARLTLEEVCQRAVSASSADHSAIIIDILCHQPMRDLPAKNDCLASLRAMDTCLPILGTDWPPFSLVIAEYTHCIIQHGLSHHDMVTRHWCARILATLAMPQHPVVDPHHASRRRLLLDTIIFDAVLPCLDSATDDHATQGAIETLLLLFHRGLLSYRLSLVVLVLPTVLRSLNSHLDTVRRTATLLFSLLLTLLPLEQHGADTSLLSADKQHQRESTRHFIDGLLHPDSISPYDVSHCIRPSLRHYQQLGVNWLAFLHRYGLHGVLADDMGLGKTLQTLAIIAGECSRDPGQCQPSLVVCPSTLTAHWLQEITKHVSSPDFAAMIYAGPTETRHSLIPSFQRHHVVITSYDILRHDIDRLQRPSSSSSSWLYLVLDEGHLIRNHKNKLALAIKSVLARHRLILTGTPIQNRVAELWSLFDFLMPGLLGPHSDFQRRYGRPLSHTNSASGKRVDSEAGTIALASLHKQVLPFMLRRIKEDVLQELPPKIMQDYVCVMSSLQQRLYSLFLGSESGSSVTDHILHADQSQSVSLDQRRHVFHALHYLRLVCNHPSLVLSPSHPLHRSITQELAANNQSLDDCDLSGKLVSLRQLILDCGLGTDESATSSSLTEDSAAALLECSSALVSSHRLLLFCQSRAMIRLVEKMLTKHLPRVSYLSMDGSVPVNNRQRIIDKFNDDPSVDILLLTTGVGGLGLNLTSADTVVFLEHDWNPTRDLQAMDRAHRIGQQRTVNVYRLITEDSIEEKIMNLQQFKTYIASTVISSDNKEIGSMHTDSILDIMNKEGNGDVSRKVEGTQGNDGGVTEYDEEYDLDNYLKML